jgi:hypothetical protein
MYQTREKGHDRLHRDRDKRVFQEKSMHFPEEPKLIMDIGSFR